MESILKRTAYPNEIEYLNKHYSIYFDNNKNKNVLKNLNTKRKSYFDPKKIIYIKTKEFGTVAITPVDVEYYYKFKNSGNEVSIFDIHYGLNILNSHNYVISYYNFETLTALEELLL